jgi:hypothetical protein
MHSLGAESSTLRETIVPVAQPACYMRLSTPTRLSDRQDRLPLLSPSQFSVMGITEALGFYDDAAMTERFRLRILPLPPRRIRVTLAKVLALIGAQVKVLDRIVRAVAVSVMNNLVIVQRPFQRIRHDQAMLTNIAARVAHGVRRADVHVNVPALIDVATAPPRWTLCACPEPLVVSVNRFRHLSMLTLWRL